MTLVRETVPFEAVGFDYAEIAKETLDKSKTKLAAIREREKEKKKRAAAINSLEAFIFDTKDKLSSEEFIKCSTEAERETISGKLDEADNWLSEADNSVETRVKKIEKIILKHKKWGTISNLYSSVAQRLSLKSKIFYRTKDFYSTEDF